MKYEKTTKADQESAGKQFAHFVKVGYNRARQVIRLRVESRRLGIFVHTALSLYFDLYQHE